MRKDSIHRGHRRDGRALTISQFCRKWRLSRSSYYDLQRRGLGPTEMRITERIIRISPRAEREWVAKKKAGESAPVPVFTPQSSADAPDSGRKGQTAARHHKARLNGRVPSTPSNPSNRRGQSDGASDTVSRRHKKKQVDTNRPRHLHPGPRIDRAGQSALKSSTRRDKRGRIASKRQKGGSTKRVTAPASNQRDIGDLNGENDNAFSRRRKRRWKKPRRGRPKQGRSGGVRIEPPLDIPELKRRLRTEKRLPKDALIESSRWRLDTNCHRRRDRKIERAMLKALIGAGSSGAEQQQALQQANCTPGARCRRLTCWLCKHRVWLKSRRRLAKILGQGVVPPDRISWVTIVIAVCEPSPTALRSPMSKFRSFLTKAADAWNVAFFGRFEIDLLLDPRVDVRKTTFKRKTLRGLGLDPESSKPAAVFHVHLIAYHPNQDRGWLSLRLKQRLPEPRRTEVSPLRDNQSQTEALDNLTRYSLKSLPPDDVFECDSRSYRVRDPKALRLHNKLVNFLSGRNGECIIRP